MKRDGVSFGWVSDACLFVRWTTLFGMTKGIAWEIQHTSIAPSPAERISTVTSLLESMFDFQQFDVTAAFER